MSHLTASPFHKPSAFEFPQRTSTTDTNHQLPTPASMSVVGGQDPHASEYFDTPAASISADAPGSRFRRAASSIVYHNSGLRESRERTVQRSSRSFLVVLPPPSLPQDHGHLGHTLSSGPRHRLSQGLLMPLFPTMYGQLNAIAREYNFPSTTGLCLYLHFNENGITATPRISDDSWQMIWGHAFDPAPSASAHHLLPICGKIEFDIDLRLARWYGAWMASSHREHVDVPMSVTPSAAPSVVHFREESRTTFADGEEQDVVRAPARHVPRKLSLVDRFDAMSARSVPRSVVARPLPADPLPSSQNLSPIFQEDEPKTAKLDLEHRVNSWRASASIHPETTGHILLTGAHLPHSPVEESPLPTSNDEHINEAGEDEYRIEDYTFSISSAGPGDYDPYSPLTWFYDPSVHLANRAQGSVCMTPTECTSFGPSDYTLSPYVPTFDLDVVHTPDIAHRMFEDVPPSPSEATSWGAPLSYPPSPTSDYRAPSVHLGDRQDFSRPVTPMTATSWGAPESFPPSPTTPFYVRTPDAGQRAFDLSALADHDAPWSLVWPYHDAAQPWAQVWPYTSDEVMQAGERGSEAPWNMVWPYHSSNVAQGSSRSAAAAAVAVAAATTPMVWPWPQGPGHVEQQRATAAPWNMVWPYHAASSGSVSVRLPAAYPCLNIYPAVYPWNLDEIYPAPTVGTTVEISTSLAVYPCLNIYPAVYPNFDIYPPVSGVWTAGGTIALERGPVAISLGAGPAAYPDNLDNIYPVPARRTVSATSTNGITTSLTAHYPFFNLYPATYPWSLSEIYPAYDVSSVISTSLAPYSYPCLNIYPAVYPHFDLYPAVSGAWTNAGTHSTIERGLVAIILAARPAGYPRNLDEIYPSQHTKVGTSSISTRLTARYPAFNLYPATYPWNLQEIYPQSGLDDIVEITTRLPATYPCLNIYPAVYPNFEIYPSVSAAWTVVAGVQSGRPEASVIYPHFDLYPAIIAASNKTVRPSERGAVVISLQAHYPAFNLYAPVYPHVVPYPPLECEMEASEFEVVYPFFDLYPAVNASSRKTLRETCTVSITLQARYPAFNLYAPVYPHVVPYPPLECEMVTEFQVVYPYFDLYPAANASSQKTLRKNRSVSVTLPARYPAFNLYPAVYPHVRPYPTFECEMEKTKTIDVRLEARYPYFSLYDAVYPDFDIYGTLLSMETPRPPRQSRFTRSDLHALMKNTTRTSRRSASKTHQDLHLAVFPRGRDVLTPSGVLRDNLRKPGKSHLDLHLTVFPSGVDVLTPSGTGVKEVFTSSSVRAVTRLRSGSVLRSSLPPSPRPVGRPVSVVPAPTTVLPPLPPTVLPPLPPTEGLRRSVSSATRPSVDRSMPRAASTLMRSTSMASPQGDRPVPPNGPRATPPRKRDSMVLQRVKALQGSPIKEDEASFPPPPRPSVARKVLS